MKARVLHYVANLAWGSSLIVVGAIAAIAYIDVSKDRRVPLEIHSASFEQQQAHAGEHVWLTVERTRVRWCPGTVREFWFRGRSVLQGDTLPASPKRSEIGRITDSFYKRIPKNLDPGDWCYEPQLIYECEDGQHVIEQLPACIRITDPKP